MLSLVVILKPHHRQAPPSSLPRLRPGALRGLPRSSRGPCRRVLTRPEAVLPLFHQSRVTKLKSRIASCLHLTYLFSIVYALFCAMGAPQPLCFQMFPHSFYRHGGVYPIYILQTCALRAHELRTFSPQLLFLPQLRFSWGEGGSAFLNFRAYRGKDH